MYSYLEIVTQQESPAVSITRTHYDARLMRMWSLQGGRVTVKESISSFDTVTRYGECGAGREREVSQDARGGGLSEARARGSRELFVLVVSIAMFRLGGFYSEMSQTMKKKKKHSVEYFFLYVVCRNRYNPLAISIRANSILLNAT